MKRYDEESANDGCNVRGVSVGEDESHVLQGANPPSQIHNQLTFFFSGGVISGEIVSKPNLI